MTMKFGLFVPQGWKMDLVGIPDPIAQYEAMTAAVESTFDQPIMPFGTQVAGTPPTNAAAI